MDFAILSILGQLVKGWVWINPEYPRFTPSLLMTSPPILLWEASNQTLKFPSLKFTKKLPLVYVRCILLAHVLSISILTFYHNFQSDK